MAELKKVLCPVDLSPQTSSAAGEAANLAEALGAELLLLHVLTEPVFTLGDPMLAPGDVTAFTQPAVLEEYRVEMDKQLCALGDLFRKRGLPVTTLLVQGSTHEAIVNAADNAHADLIVMSTHGHTGLSHFLLGSVTERVVRTAKVPVMTLRAN
jgi:universal stress protein A